MKGWKILGVLVIVGMFLMPMMPVTKATHPVLPPCENEGDIVLADGSRIPKIPEWDHAKQLEDNYGKIEWTNLQQTYWDYYNAGFTPEEKQHVAIAYCKVIGLSQDKLNTLRYRVTRFAYDKLTDPDDDGIEEHPEHRFDLISYWKDDTKQESGSSERAQRYYCSELVWAAYRYASRNYIGITVDMDPDSHKVTPLEIHDSDWTECYWQYGTPW